jgi:hypothetical protein
MGKGIHGWIGGRYGSPTEYGLPLDDSYLFEGQEEEDEPDPLPCACKGEGWVGCDCTGRAGALDAEALEDALLLEPDPEPEAGAGGDDWTPVRIEGALPHGRAISEQHAAAGGHPAN